MDCYILKKTKKTEQILPEDLLVLNEEGAVAIWACALYEYAQTLIRV